METLETLIANLSGKTRRETFQGRDFLVAPLTLIVPGVLNGSKGALYYPPDEVAKNPDDWNGMPIVVYHPTANGIPVSARDPEILEKSGIGYVYRSVADGNLGAEGWFDTEATSAYDEGLEPEIRLLPRLEADTPIALSTGLFTSNTPAEPGATHNGKPYDFVAGNYRPDHLAILPDQVGACSIDDGCGVLVNSGDEDEKSKATIWQRLGELLGINASYFESCPRDEKGHCSSGGGGGGGESAGKSGDGKDAAGKSGGASTKVKDASSAADAASKKVAFPKKLGVSASGQGESESASKASKEANKKNTQESHQEAAKAHKAAAAAHDKAVIRMHQVYDEGHTGSGVGKQTERWKQQAAADAHRAAAEAHSEAATTAPKSPPKKEPKVKKEPAPKKEATPPPAAPKVELKKSFWGKLSGLFSRNEDYSNSEIGDANMTRKEIIGFLTTNCDCWKSKEDAEVLNRFSDDKLSLLKTNTEKVLILNSLKASKVTNAEGDSEVAGIDIGELAGFLGITIDPAKDPAGFIKEIQAKLEEIQQQLAGPATTDTPADEVAMDEPAVSVANKRPQWKSAKEWLADPHSAPADVKAAVANSMKLERKARAELIAKITANVAEDRREMAAKRLQGKTLEQLEEISDLLPVSNRRAQRDDEEPAFNYSGAGGGFGVAGSDEEDILPPPTINWGDRESA